ncbi:flavodoxin family protein [Anaeroselena agilis]|uniref:Flavodoxin family protein n=1 Tax=Anaeroselena agilis TaxID=3063788 RepID=A0ABU3P2B2_9FIRM|nr:flavodoxin family protein [Selenomonadales bacterium 4137-cl]
MKALAVCGSPRKNGNTEYYLRLFLSELAAKGIETEFLWLGDKRILPCKGCYGCLEHKACVQQDDFEEIFARMQAADAIIVGSPVYVSKPTGLLASLLERVTFSARASGRMLSGKVGAPVTVARRAGQTFAFAELLLWYFINDMIIPGSMYWNVGVAGAKGAIDADRDLEGIEIIKYAAANMARVIQALQTAGANAPVDRDKLFFTPPASDK